jgi:hypothetical protein
MVFSFVIFSIRLHESMPIPLPGSNIDSEVLSVKNCFPIKSAIPMGVKNCPFSFFEPAESVEEYLSPSLFA